MVKIAPSFLSADFRTLEHEVRAVEAAGAEYIHLDVMDGHFVPNLTFGPLVVDAVRKLTGLTLDTHLMITDPGQYLQPFADSGADILTVHVEIDADLPELLGRIRDAGMRSGASVKPATPADVLFPLLPSLDLALVMSVEPGFGGQSFMPESLPKVRALKDEIARQGTGTEIEIDGGIGTDNAGEVAAAGAEVLVAGSSVFRDGKVSENVAALRRAAEGAN
ncbi:MAG: ribulose-phosphate 3-epimerase [Candidatus Latescibacteria bacterium]|jgi:ribulose-phosphate 3-epimerase|nr:ribulose-phosphate 3-epimerase [Candidatus Latescibacterota bacterium]